MDEYTPRYLDIAQLQFLCEKLFDEGSQLLNEHSAYSVNDPTAVEALQLNELIDHVANVAINYRIKYRAELELTSAINEFLDHSSLLLGNYSVTPKDTAQWKAISDNLFSLFKKNKHQR